MLRSLMTAAAFALLASGCHEGSPKGNDGDTDGTGELSVAFHEGEMERTGYPGGPTLLVAEVGAGELDVVTLSVTTEPDAACEVTPAEVTGGGVVEVVLRPAAANVDQVVAITLRAESHGDVATDVAEVRVVGHTDTEGEFADSLLADFLAYLEANHAEMGLGPGTEWIESFPTYPSILIVGHRTYLSAGWDLHLAWHVTIAPHDWSYVTVRRRTDLDPVLGLCFPSQTEDRTVQEAILSDPRLPCAE